MKRSKRQERALQQKWRFFQTYNATKALEEVLTRIPPVDPVAAHQLHAALHECSKTLKPPSFASAGGRSGYIQQRLKSRSQHIGSILLHPELDKWLDTIKDAAAENKSLTLHAYGGGPGFEILGLCLIHKFLELPGNVKGVSLDNEEGWADAVEAVNAVIRNEEIGGEARFETCDISIPLEGVTPVADIVTFAYVVLENCTLLRETEYRFLKDLFAQSAAGTTFLFIDSSPRMWPDITRLVVTDEETEGNVFEFTHLKMATCKWTLLLRCRRSVRDAPHQILAPVLPCMSAEALSELENEFETNLAHAEERASTESKILDQVEVSLELTASAEVRVSICVGGHDINSPLPLSRRKRRAQKREAKSFDQTIAVQATALEQCGPWLELHKEIVFEYAIESFDFGALIRDIIGVPQGVPLDELHRTTEGQEMMGAKLQSGHRGNLYQCRWQRAKTGAGTGHCSPQWDRFATLLRTFVRQVVAPLMGGTEGLVYQAEPTLRVQMPCEKAMGKPHCDADYHHLPEEVNFWIPFSAGLCSQNTLWSESRPGLGDFHPFLLRPGQVCRFYGNKCRHFTKPNTSDSTRVSMDLRVISRASGGYRENPRFRLGEYFEQL